MKTPKNSQEATAEVQDEFKSEPRHGFRAFVNQCHQITIEQEQPANDEVERVFVCKREALELADALRKLADLL